MYLFFKCLFVQFVVLDISLGYDNISAYKPTGQRTYLGKKGFPQKAVDRSIFTCSTKDFSGPAWWYVDLGKVKSIYDVQIYFSLYSSCTFGLVEGQQHVYRYELYISNSTDFSLLHEAYLCYNHTGPEKPAPNVTHTCVLFGRYVIFYNNRLRFTLLCEVIVQGCEEDGVYGFNCNETCPTNCQERRCYVTNGTCVGCKDGWTGEKCLNACPAGKYGAECKKTCTDHCGNNTSCNHMTGQCEGCLSGWMGYDCNENDLSAYKPTMQGYGHKIDVAANAVDRSIYTCSSTDLFNPAWWYVDLQKVKSIFDVEIYYRLYSTEYEQRQRERMYGYKLYISNSTDFSLLHEAYLCYSHSGQELPELNVTHVCVSFGRYVIFYNERGVPGVTYPKGVNPKETFTQLCEVIVQSCKKDGVYGSFCNKSCPSNCQERRCYITNGTCAGCKDGWIGEKCLDACPAGKYGAECKKTCTDHCGNNTSCSHVTGQCEGCLSGWMGHDCNEICPSGTYGRGCEQNCSGNCFNNDTCYNVNGNCPRGCLDEFRGNRCDEQSVVVDFNRLCSDQKANIAGLTAGLIISLLINVGFCFLVVLHFIRKRDVTRFRKNENKKENDKSSYEVSDRGPSQQRTSEDHLENHTYEDLNATRTTRAPQVYRNLSLNDTRTGS